MRLDDEGESQNVEDRRGLGPVHIAGGGIGAVVLALIGYFVFGISPQQLLGPSEDQAQQQGQVGAPSDPQGVFAAKVLRSTEDVWGVEFSQTGRSYEPPVLVLYDGATTTACGFGQSAMGPFYCPGDRRVYLDLSFFRDLESRFGAPGQAARAYVIAHEVGHHVQNLLGISDKVAEARQAAGGRTGANRISVETELQADCFAGVWAKASGRMDTTDVDQALNAAAAVGDDRLQRQSQGVVVPDSFTHGSSADRQKWFRTGYQSGDPDACDTFGTGVGFNRGGQAGRAADAGAEAD